MKDIQFNTSVSKEEWEKLHHTYIHEWELAVAVQKALVKKGCYTIGDVIDMSDVELQKIIETIPTSYAELINPKRLENIKNILKERNITLPTEEEKQSILDSLSEEEQLKREIKILKYKNERLEEKKYYLEERVERVIRFIRDEENEIAEELGTLIAEEKNPLPIILKGMVYKNTNITLCKLFKLYTKGCSLDKNYAEELPLSNCCEKCIEEFLEQYFMEQGREC